jgi:hypothetical protein
VNWDVAVDSHKHCLGCGVIVWDQKGFVISAQSKRINVLQELVIAKAMAALEVLEFSRDLGYRTLSLRVIHYMLSKPLRTKVEI